MQHLLGRAKRDADLVRDAVRDYVPDPLVQESGVTYRSGRSLARFGC